jgi:hypothetical protein
MKFLLLLLLVSCASTKSGYELAGEFCSCRGGVKNFVDYTEQDDPKHYVACKNGIYSAFYGDTLDYSTCYPEVNEPYNGNY